MRKLAREATVFALLGMLLAVTVIFVYADLRDRTAAQDKAAEAVHASAIDPSGGTKGATFVQVPLRNGTVLHIRECGIFDKLAVWGKDCRDFSGPIRKVNGQLGSIALGSVDQLAIERDYWEAYKTSRHQRISLDILRSLLFGSLGFPAGLALWIFYRLVRFAIQG